MREVGNGARWTVMGLAILAAVGALHVGFLNCGGMALSAEPRTTLDTRGIEIIQKIPVGEDELFHAKFIIDEMLRYYAEDELKALGFNLIPAELILSSIAALVIQQMGLEAYLTTEPETGIVTVQGEFGKKLWEILGIGPLDGGVLVEHVELEDLLMGKRDSYTLTINCREIELELEDGFIGFAWGVRGLVLRQHYEGRRSPAGIPYTEEKELFIHQVESKVRPGTYIMVALFTWRLYRPDGTLVEVEQWYFVQGNPSPVHYGREVKGE